MPINLLLICGKKSESEKNEMSRMIIIERRYSSSGLAHPTNGAHPPHSLFGSRSILNKCWFTISCVRRRLRLDTTSHWRAAGTHHRSLVAHKYTFIIFRYTNLFFFSHSRFLFVYCRFDDYYIPSLLFHVVQFAISFSFISIFLFFFCFFPLRWPLSATRRAARVHLPNKIHDLYGLRFLMCLTNSYLHRFEMQKKKKWNRRERDRGTELRDIECAVKQWPSERTMKCCGGQWHTLLPLALLFCLYLSLHIYIRHFLWRASLFFLFEWVRVVYRCLYKVECIIIIIIMGKQEIYDLPVGLNWRRCIWYAQKCFNWTQKFIAI